MLSFGASEDDIVNVKVRDIDLGNGTVRLRPSPGSDAPRVLPFTATCAGRCSCEVFDRYLAFSKALVRLVRMSNAAMVEPEELLVHEQGAELLPFKEASTSVTNRLREIGKASGIRLTEGILLRTYRRNRSYEERSDEAASKAGAPSPESVEGAVRWQRSRCPGGRATSRP